MAVKAEIKGLADLAADFLPQVEKQVKAKTEYAMKETLETFAPALEQYLQRLFAEVYANSPESPYYTRTGDFVDSLKVKITQGRGYYGLKIFFDQQELRVGITPKGMFNQHADYNGVPIDIDDLIILESKNKFGTKDALTMWLLSEATQYINNNLPNRVKISLDRALNAPSWKTDF